MIEGRVRYVLYMAVLALPLACWNGAFPLDDAYIVLHNARVLLGGADDLYRTSALTGSTSAVHLLLVALGGWLFPLPLASLLVGVAAAIAYAIGLDRLVTKMGARGWPGVLLVIAGLAGGVVPLQLFNGLETGLAAAVVTWLLVLADDRRVPFVAGLAPFVRPELALLSALVLARRWWGQRPGTIIRELAAAAWVALPFAVGALLATGHLVPQTAAAKAAFFARDDWPALLRGEFLLSALVQSGFLPLCLGLPVLRRGGWLRTAFVVLVLGVSAATIPDAVTWNHCRYLVPLVPVLIASLAVIANAGPGRIVAVAAAALSLACLPSSLAMLRQEQGYWLRELELVRSTVAPLPAGSTVLIHDAGIIAWLNPRVHLVDAVGLKTPRSTVWHRRFTRQGCEMGQALDGMARESGAAYALVLPQIPWSCIETNLRGAGWRLTLQPGASHYRLLKLAPPAP